VSEVHADIEALKGFHEALVRFRYAQRGVAERGGDAIEMTRASLAAKASRGQARLEQCQAELDACRAGGGQDEPPPDCSAYARAVEQASEQLEHIRRWQQRVDAEASEFAGPAGGFADLLDTDLPRAESQLLAAIASLEAARRVQAGGS
jgi:capsule polysaccharide export protein KpsE/RkpR